METKDLLSEINMLKLIVAQQSEEISAILDTLERQAKTLELAHKTVVALKNLVLSRTPEEPKNEQ